MQRIVSMSARYVPSSTSGSGALGGGGVGGGAPARFAW
jgi:hypothetical protein